MKRIERLGKFRFHNIANNEITFIYPYEDTPSKDINFHVYINGDLFYYLGDVGIEISRVKNMIPMLNGISITITMYEFIRSLLEGLLRDNYVYTPLHQLIEESKIEVKDSIYIYEIHLTLPKEKEIRYE